MLSTSFFAGNALTVARGYGQHHPTRDASAPKFAWMFEIGTIFFTAGERRNSHWSAVVQSRSSQRPSGAQTAFAKTPAPAKICRVGPASMPVNCNELRPFSVSTKATFFPSGEMAAETTNAAPLSSLRN